MSSAHGTKTVGFLLLIILTVPVQAQWSTSPDGFRYKPLAVNSSTSSGFIAVPTEISGISFVNQLADSRSLTNQVFLNGSGVAAGDVNGDGLADLVFCGLDSPNALYLNRGNWVFENRTEAANIGSKEQASTGCVLADIDGDGDLDLLVTGLYNGVRLFLNDGQARFTEKTIEAGLQSSHGFTTLALADINGNGWLDLYATNYRNDTIRDFEHLDFKMKQVGNQMELVSFNGKPASHPDVRGRFSFAQGSGVLENGGPDVLYRNLGGGRFEAIQWTDKVFKDHKGMPMDPLFDWGLSAMFHDINNDRHPDLYVCNDFQSPDRFWINDGQGTFTEIAPTALRQTSLFSMGIDFADLNGDDWVDFFVADMLSPDHQRRQQQVMDATAFSQYRSSTSARPQYPRNSLYINQGNMHFSEISQFAGLNASDWSWCPVFMDVDLDGHPDLLITTGHWRDAQNADIAMGIEKIKTDRNLSPAEVINLRSRYPRLETPNYAFRNTGQLNFEDWSAQWRFDSKRISHGMVQADLDGDGDLDLVINCLNDNPLVLKNNCPNPRIAIRLRSSSANRYGIGSVIQVRAPGLPLQRQEIIAGGRYLSSDEPLRQFAVQREEDLVSVEIHWRNGAYTHHPNLKANHLYEFHDKDALPKTTPVEKPTVPLFEDVSHVLSGHHHKDEPFDDDAFQSLLPYKLSEPGIGATWFDFNRDGWHDVILPTGRGGQLAAFRNDGQGSFIPQKAGVLNRLQIHDQTMVLGSLHKPDETALFTAYAHYETGPRELNTLEWLSLTSGILNQDLLKTDVSLGPMAMADIDGDGDLDLFVGGRTRAARFPEPVDSFLYLRTGDTFTLDLKASRVLKQLGQVEAARFCDLNNDGFPELIVTRDWNSPLILINQKGRLVPWDPDIHLSSEILGDSPIVTTLSSLKGWWRGVAAADLNNDGRMDLILGNWGRNSSRGNANEAHRLYYPIDRSKPGWGLLETRWDRQMQAHVPVRDWMTLGSAFPSLLSTFESHTQFSRARVNDILSSGLPDMVYNEVSYFDSVALLNHQGHFTLQSLPDEAQWTPAFGVASGDFDGDGYMDVVLGQNAFAVASTEHRMDAGRGLFLKGDGTGNFIPFKPMDSGIHVEGEGRGAAVCDFDHDGRLDIMITQNRGPTRLYRNAHGTPGIRVEFEGPPGNASAIGTQARLKFENNSLGPIHETSLGTGYASQDASSMIMAVPFKPVELQILWPGGMKSFHPIHEPIPPHIKVAYDL